MSKQSHSQTSIIRVEIRGTFNYQQVVFRRKYVRLTINFPPHFLREMECKSVTLTNKSVTAITNHFVEPDGTISRKMQRTMVSYVTHRGSYLQLTHKYPSECTPGREKPDVPGFCALVLSTKRDSHRNIIKVQLGREDKIKVQPY